MLDKVRWANPNTLSLQVGDKLWWATLPPDTDLGLPLDDFMERYVKPAIFHMLQKEAADAEEKETHAETAL